MQNYKGLIYGIIKNLVLEFLNILKCYTFNTVNRYWNSENMIASPEKWKSEIDINMIKSKPEGAKQKSIYCTKFYESE